MKKRMISLIMAMVMCFSLLPITARAANPVYLAIGDSITTGYKSDTEKVSQPFANQLAQEEGYDLTNLSADGETSQTLLGKLMDDGSEISQKLPDADLITITIGGNDLMGALYSFLLRSYNETNPTNPLTLQKLMDALKKPAENVFLLLALMGYIPDFPGSAEETQALADFENNLSQILSLIQSKNKDATVILTTQYNPYSHITDASAQSIINAFEQSVTKLNQKITASGATVADVYTPFKEAAAAGQQLTNAVFDTKNLANSTLDIHPNQEGHNKIAQIIQGVLPEPQPEHSHPICGASCTHSGSHSAVAWQPLTLNDSGVTNLSAGNYYLEKDEALTGGIIEIRGTVNLCLNGHILDLKGQSIEVYGTLNLCDCSGTTTYGNISGTAGLWEKASQSGNCDLTGGVIMGGSAGGAINVANGTFHMYGGNLAGNSGDVVVNMGLDSNFSMYGGSITGNVCYYSAVNIIDGAFRMYGGSIARNQTGSGAVGYCLDGSTENSSFSMYGGSITDNEGTTYGGVYVTNGNFTISGAPVITGNTAGGQASNVWLNLDRTIQVGGALEEGAKIGVTARDVPSAITTGWETNMGSADPSSYLVSDDPANAIVLENGEAQMRTKVMHSHPICGASCTHSGSHSDVDWQPLTLNDSGVTILSAGNYYLEKDEALTGGIIVIRGAVNLCLNGHILDLKGQSIEVYGTLNLCDCSGTTTYGNISGTAGLWEKASQSGNCDLTGGVIMGGNRGEAIFVGNGSFYMYGGNLAGNSNYHVICAVSSDNFSMYGGSITGNVCYYSAVGISYGAFRMYGGSIARNQTESGAVGYCLEGSSEVESFSMYGGSITDNEGTTYGGVYVGNDNFTISGAPVITGNTAGGQASNVWLKLDRTIQVGGALEEGAKIGVTDRDVPSAITTGWETNMGSADPSSYLVSDDPANAIVLENGEAQMRIKRSVTLDPDGGTIQSGNIDSYLEGTVVALPTDVTKDGYIFEGWFDQQGQKMTEISATTKGDLVLKAHWTKKSSGGGTVVYPVETPKTENGKVTVNSSWAAEDSLVTITVTPEEGYELDFLTVTDSTGKELEITKAGEDKYTFRMPKKGATVKAGFRLDYASCHGAESCPMRAFTDVDVSAWYHDGVHYCLSKELMDGVSATTFDPDGNTSRGMLVTILYRLDGKPEVSGENSFTDVEEGAYYADAIQWAAEHDIMGGYGNGLVGPNDPITREQMAAILYRYALYKGYDVSQKADLSGYGDVDDISPYAKDAMAWTNAQGLITGMTDNTLAPRGNATRAQIATILMRLCENIVK